MNNVVKITLISTLMLILTGCKSKVYHVRGELESTLKPEQCEPLLSQSEFQFLKNRLDLLIAEARTVRDPEALRWYFQEVEKISVQVRNTFTHEHSLEQYPSTYRWTFHKTRKMIKHKPLFIAEKLAVDQVQFPVNELKVTEDEWSLIYTWKRNISLLEYCMGSETAFSWIRIENSQTDENEERLEDYLLLNGVH